jgi:hypothetical protein
MIFDEMDEYGQFIEIDIDYNIFSNIKNNDNNIVLPKYNKKKYINIIVILCCFIIVSIIPYNLFMYRLHSNNYIKGYRGYDFELLRKS